MSSEQICIQYDLDPEVVNSWGSELLATSGHLLLGSHNQMIFPNQHYVLGSRYEDMTAKWEAVCTENEKLRQRIVELETQLNEW